MLQSKEMIFAAILSSYQYWPCFEHIKHDRPVRRSANCLQPVTLLIICYAHITCTSNSFHTHTHKCEGIKVTLLIICYAHVTCTLNSFHTHTHKGEGIKVTLLIICYAHITCTLNSFHAHTYKGEGIKVNSTLEELLLNGNAIGDDGARHLMAGLKGNKTLECLSLQVSAQTSWRKSSAFFSWSQSASGGWKATKPWSASVCKWVHRRHDGSQALLSLGLKVHLVAEK